VSAHTKFIRCVICHEYRPYCLRGRFVNVASQHRDIPCSSFDYTNFVTHPASTRSCIFCTNRIQRVVLHQHDPVFSVRTGYSTLSRTNTILYFLYEQDTARCPAPTRSCIFCTNRIQRVVPRFYDLLQILYSMDPVHLPKSFRYRTIKRQHDDSLQFPATI